MSNLPEGMRVTLPYSVIYICFYLDIVKINNEQHLTGLFVN